MINKTALRKLESANTDVEWRKAVRATKATGSWRDTDEDRRKLADLEELKDEQCKRDIPKEVADFIRPGKSKDESRPILTMVNVRDRGGMRIIEATDGYQLRWAEVGRGVKCGVYHLRETIPQIVWAKEQPIFPDTEAIIPKPDQVAPTHWRTVRTLGGQFCYVTKGKTTINVAYMKGLKDGGQMWEYKGGLTTRPIMYSQYLNERTPGTWLAMPMNLPRR